MGGGTTTQSGTSTQVNQIPAWMTDAGQQNYAFAQQVAEQPLQQYQGQMVAGTSPQTQQSWNVAANSGNVGADQYNASTAGYLGALSQNPMNVTAGQISNTNLQPYMNPYTQSVINATMPIMQQQNALSQNQQANAANSSNAFGGSRQGIQQGVAQAQGAQNIGQMLAGLNSDNFTQAQAAATGDISRTMAAQQGNQTAQQQKINSDIAASQGLMNTGDAMSKNNVANFNMLQSAGAGQSMQQQNQINAQMAKFNQAFNYPQQQLGTLLSALGMTPHDTSSSGQTTQQTTTPTDWASIISKGAGAASNVFAMSDRSMKTDITKLGKDSKTGLTMHAFRYKGDPKSYPKVVGPMAQEVEKKYPGSTTPMGEGGKLAIRGYAAGTPFVLPNMTPASDMGEQSTWRMGGGADSREEAISMARPELKHLQDQQDFDRAMGREPRRYASGTPFVQPSLAAFTPPSSPGVAKGIGAMSAFAPKIKLPRGATMPAMPKHFAFGTSNVTPDMDDADLGDQVQGGDTFGDGGGIAGGLAKLGKDIGGGDGGGGKAPPEMKKAPGGWNAPSMGYSVSGFAGGTPQVPQFGSTDTVPSLLTPGEAVLTPGAAQHVGRGKIAALNAMMPPTRGQATSMPRAGARGIAGALANTKLRPKFAGGLGG